MIIGERGVHLKISYPPTPGGGQEPADKLSLKTYNQSLEVSKAQSPLQDSSSLAAMV